VVTACLTGASGFIGSHVLKTLASQPGACVRILSRGARGPAPASPAVRVVVGDLLDATSLRAFVDRGAVVVNVAYLAGREPGDNRTALENLARACAAAGVSRVVHVSTAVVVGRTPDRVVTEATACSPANAYEASKLEGEEILLGLLRGVCAVTIVRPTEVFGEGGRGLLKLARSVRHDSPLTGAVKLALSGRRRLNLVYVWNVAAAIGFLAAVDAPVDGRRYIVSDDDAPENNYHDVVQFLRRLWRRPPVPAVACPPALLSVLLRARGRSNVDPRRTYSAARLAALGFRERIPFTTGLERFARWYAAQPSEAAA